MRIALYQPEIAGNTGAVLRIAACFGLPVDVIGPTGFVWSEARMRRAHMDYADRVDYTRHPDWTLFKGKVPGRRVLLTTRAVRHVDAARFRSDDVLVFGNESSGVPEDVAADCQRHVRIPIARTSRSLNLSVAVGIAAFEALRQVGELPA